MRNTLLVLLLCGLRLIAADKTREWQTGQVVESKASVGPQIHTIAGTGKNYLIKGSVGGDDDALKVGTTVRFAVEGKSLFISLEGKEYRLNVLGETLAAIKEPVPPAAVATSPAPPTAPVPAPVSAPAPTPVSTPALPAAPVTPARRPAPTPPAEGAQPLDNDAVVKMILAGLKDDTVTQVIEARPGRYVLTREAVAGLRAAGVSQNVIAAMSAKMKTSR